MKIKLTHVAFEVTSTCNLNCRYCYNYWKSPFYKEEKYFNSYKLARKTLKRLLKIADISYLSFTGGEPFAAERFKELVLFAKMKGKSVTIITNGNAASYNDYKETVAIGVNLYELPMHSENAEIHDFLTTVKGSWQKSVDSIKTLVAMNAEVVAVIVITKQNFNEIDKTLSFISSLGVKRIMLNRFNIGGNGIGEKQNLLMTKDELNTAFKIASVAGRKLKLALSSNVCTPLCVVNTTDYKNILFTKCSPDVTKRPLTVDIEGDLRFCNHSPTILGNIYTDKLEDMFNSEAANLWSKTIPDYCSSCDLYSSCMAGCRAASEQLNLGLNSPDPIVSCLK